MLIRAAVPIGSASPTSLSGIKRLDLFNPASAPAYWDEITFD
jgi:hypothetical protein